MLGQPDKCTCGRLPSIVQWRDTKRPNCTWIECSCGFMSNSYYDKDPDKAKAKAIKAWGKKAGKRTTTNVRGFKSCPKCGSKELNLVETESTFSKKECFVLIQCKKCKLTIDEIDKKGNIKTKKQIKEQWNG